MPCKDTGGTLLDGIFAAQFVRQADLLGLLAPELNRRDRREYVLTSGQPLFAC